ncbi:hypothetical protein, partial [Pseudomonas sp. SWI36]|uniref:hypothetical protein n=1 Tax=Pseudomonas sp. SWI36 TaxID=2083052 RepID=UPI001C49BFB1
TYKERVYPRSAARAALDLTGAENESANTSKFQRRPLKIPTPSPQNSNTAPSKIQQQRPCKPRTSSYYS